MKLKNGQEEHDALVSVTLHTLRDLIKNRPVHFYELVNFARNPKHEFFGNTGRDLENNGFIALNDGHYSMHESIRNIIVSAVVGDGLEMRLVSPRAE